VPYPESVGSRSPAAQLTRSTSRRADDGAFADFKGSHRRRRHWRTEHGSGIQSQICSARDLLAGPQERLPHPPVAVGEVVARVRRRDSGALIVGGRRHAQGPADRLDPETAAMLLDIAAHLGRSRSSSLAKNTEADFRISFARRSSKFSLPRRAVLGKLTDTAIRCGAFRA
jgi:hypothetical protein